MNINSENIQHYEKKVDIFPMTEGARNAILRKLTDLKLREQRLVIMSLGMKSDDLTIIEKLMEEIRNTIRTPIRDNCNLLLNTTEVLPELLFVTFEKLTKAVIHHIRGVTNESRMKKVTSVSSSACSLMKKAWACYFFESCEKNRFNEFRELIEKNLRLKKLELARLECHYKLIAFVAAAPWKEK